LPILPQGTVTFLFTDIEGSTRLWERLPEEMKPALARHDDLLRSCIEQNRGAVVKTTGDGYHAAFARAQDGVAAALAAQRALAKEPWDPNIGQLLVRMALHTGTAEERKGDYYGPAVNRAARLMSAAFGGQVLLSQITRELVLEQLPETVSTIDPLPTWGVLNTPLNYCSLKGGIPIPEKFVINFKKDGLAMTVRIRIRCVVLILRSIACCCRRYPEKVITC
jgi:class 3 adenylate cyclase